jgi:hypothetical protein
LSSFSWLDFAEQDRRKALEVIDLFRERDTVDELGIGTIRDALSEILLPATSVIHSRARYFFFVPWIYLELERKRVPAERFAREARRRELQLVETLLASNDHEGTIGRRARSTLKILPSAIYWQALRQLGIRLVPAPRERYHRTIDRFYATVGKGLQNDDGEIADRIRAHNWQPRMPPAPEDFPEVAVMSLRRDEAEYLRDRIVFRAPKSLYRFLVEDPEPSTKASFPWQFHRLVELPIDLQKKIMHARNFSEAIQGAPLLYNLMLAELLDREEEVVGYREDILAWRTRYDERREEFGDWSRFDFWTVVTSEGARIPPLTRLFVENWLQMAHDIARGKLISDKRPRLLVHERERQLKRGQARLDSQRARELWRGESGTAQLSYRWHIAQLVVADIAKGLRGRSNA